MSEDEQIDELLKDYELLKHQDCDDSCGNKGTELEAKQAIKKLLLEVTKPYIEIISLYGVPTCDSVHHPKKYQHSSLEDCPVVERIDQLTKEVNSL